MKSNVRIMLAFGFGIAIVLAGFCFFVSEKQEVETPRICTMDYTPVCGIDGVTYGNACTAGDVEIDYAGECRESHVCTDEEKASQICTRDYRPVCGVDGVTYGNGCSACSAGVDSWIEGECLV